MKKEYYIMADQKKYQQLIDEIVPLVGGKKNIASFAHCVTRLRFNVNDKASVQSDAVKKLPGAVGVNWSGNQFQVIIGQAVADVYAAICAEHGLQTEAAIQENLDAKQPKTVGGVISAICSGIAGCVIPLLPILIGAGMLKVIITMLTSSNLMAADNPTLVTLGFVADAAFYFLPVFVGSMAAKKFGANQSIGMLLGAMLISPTFIDMVNNGTPGSIFGLPIYGASYSSSIFPVICTVFIAGYVERFVAKHSPDAVRNILEPVVTLLVMIPLTFVVIAPLGAILGDGLAWALTLLYEKTGFVAIAIQAAFYPLIVMTGMHVGLIPIGMTNLMTLGYEPNMITCVLSNLNQGASCLAVALRTKDRDLRSTAISSAITAIFGGVTEPAMFGINLPLKTPLYGAMLGSLISGAVAGLLKVRAYSFGSTAFPFTMFCYVNPDGSGILACLISILVGLACTFVFTLFLYQDKGSTTN